MRVLLVGIIVSILAEGLATHLRLRGVDLPSDKEVILYNYVYWGGSLTEDIQLEGFPEMVPNVPVAVRSQSDPEWVLNLMYQLPEDGRIPESLVVDGVLQSFFSAILRYDPHSQEDIQRVRDWIGNNIQYCENIFVINYPIPIESEEERAALYTLSNSFVDEAQVVVGLAVGITDSDPSGLSLVDFLQIFSTVARHPHQIMVPRPQRVPLIDYLVNLFWQSTLVLDMFL